MVCFWVFFYKSFLNEKWIYNKRRVMYFDLLSRSNNFFLFLCLWMHLMSFWETTAQHYIEHYNQGCHSIQKLWINIAVIFLEIFLFKLAYINKTEKQKMDPLSLIITLYYTSTSYLLWYDINLIHIWNLKYLTLCI